jgi:CubicO group peptidase (beta-lactamase class C family)
MRSRAALRSVFELVRRQSQVAPGRYAALGVGSADGPIATEAFIDGELVEPAPSSSIASLTKPITATAVMQLVEAGSLELDEPVAKHLPEFSPSLPVGARRAEPVTIRHVLAHTSGLADLPDAKLRSLPPTPEAMLATISRMRLRFGPGTAYAYASDPWYLLSAIIERVSGVRFPAFVADRILRPLRMTATSFDPTSLPGSVLPPEGSMAMAIAPDRPLDVFASLEMPGGGLWSTPADLLRFARAMLRGGELDGVRIIGPRAFDAMVDDQTGELTRFGTNDPVHYALGWDRPGLAADGPLPPASFTHTGANGSILAVDPTNDVVIVYLRNRWGSSMDLTAQTMDEVYAALRA